MFIKTIGSTIQNILKYKSVSLIKLIVLSVGLTCFSLVYIFVNNELKFDTFHQNSERTYRLLTANKNNGETYALQPAVLLNNLLNDFPEISNATSFYNWGQCSFKHKENLFLEKGFFLVDTNFLKVFDFPLKTNNTSHVLNNPFELLVTESAALKYFGDKNPVGEVLVVDNKYSFTITGILNDIPTSSHLQFDFLGSLNSFNSINEKVLTEWNYSFTYIYLLLNKGISSDDLASKFESFLQKHRGERIASLIELKLERFLDIRLRSVNTNDDLAIKGNIKHVHSLILICLFLIIIACFNYSTLTISITRHRAKEIGIRKVNGATQKDIFFQFLFETLFLSFISIILATIITYIVLPYINIFFDRHLFLNLEVILTLLIISLVIIPLAAGGYPAFLLSRLNPSLIIGGNIDNISLTSNSKKILNPKSTLVFLQISFAIITVILTILLYMQLNLFNNIHLGFDKKDIIVIENPYHNKTTDSYSILKDFFVNQSNTLYVSTSSDVPPYGLSTYHMISLEEFASDEKFQMPIISVCPDFFNVLNSKIKHGKNFSSESLSSNTFQVIINESAMLALNIKDPIGMRVLGVSGSQPYSIIGVVEDIHFGSIREKVEPMIFLLDSKLNRYILIKTSSNTEKTSIPVIANYWNKIAPDYIFQYSFMSENILNGYINDQKMAYVFSVFSLITIILSIIGFYGFISFHIETSIKEIALRFIFGANTFSLINGFMKRIFGVLFLAYIVSWPIAYLLIDYWLNEYSQKIRITFQPFIYTSLFFFIIIYSCFIFQIISMKNMKHINALKK